VKNAVDVLFWVLAGEQLCANSGEILCGRREDPKKRAQTTPSPLWKDPVG